jgi:acyl-CoA reductase-like NAD-dependent aldehyde dehydrogenase
VAFVDRTADISAAAHAVIEARFSRRGSSPYGPDVVLVNEFVLEEFLVYLVRHISPYMAYENGSTSGDSSKHKQHWLSMESQRILDTAEKSEDMRLVVRGSNGSIVTVQNR